MPRLPRRDFMVDVAEGDCRRSLDDHPVLRPSGVSLIAEPFTGLDGDPHALSPRRIIEDGEGTPKGARRRPDYSRRRS